MRLTRFVSHAGSFAAMMRNCSICSFLKVALQQSFYQRLVRSASKFEGALEVWAA